MTDSCCCTAETNTTLQSNCPPILKNGSWAEGHQLSETHSLASLNSYMHAQSLSRVLLSVIPRTVARQALPSMEFSRQEYWSGLPFLTPGDLPDPGIKPASLVSPAF